MKNTIYRFVSLGMCVAGVFIGAGTVHAAGSAQCQLMVSDPSVTYDIMTRATFHHTGPSGFVFGQRVISLSVTCDRPANLSLKFTGKPGVDGLFAFGHNGKMPVGLQQVQLDGRAVQISAAGDAHAPSQAGDRTEVSPGDVVSGAPGHPWFGKQLTMQILVDPSIPLHSANVVTNTSFQSNMTIVLLAQ